MLIRGIAVFLLFERLLGGKQIANMDGESSSSDSYLSSSSDSKGHSAHFDKIYEPIGATYTLGYKKWRFSHKS